MYKEKHYGKMKKTMMIILLVVILVMLPTKVEAAEQSSSADLLKILHIVEGDGSGFAEDKQLTRAEAVTLVLRLTQEVESSLDPVFSDVTNTDWYYDSVMKAYNVGMISGYTDGTFRANNYVTRQEFLKMLLEVLDYKYAIDFTWAEVGMYSETLDLVSDINEPNAFIRRDAFNILIELLKTNSNKTNVKYLDKLVTLNKITDLEYEEFKKAYNVEPLVAEKISAPSTETIIMTLNNQLSTEQPVLSVNIYQDNNKNINVQGVRISGNQILFDVDPLEIDGNYTIEVKQITDQFGHISDLKDSTISMDNEAVGYEFFLKDMEVTGTKTIELSFSNAVDTSMLLTSYFKVSVNDKNTFFQAKSIVEDKVILILNSEVMENDEIDITIFGSFKDSYGFKFLDGYTMTKTIGVVGSLLDNAKVETIESLTTGVVRVVFDQPMDFASATNRLNYEVKDLSEGLAYRSVSKVIATGSGDLTNRQFDVVNKYFIDNNIYYLKVQNMDAIGGAYHIYSQQTKVVYVDDGVLLKVLSTEAKDLNHIVLTFNKPMDEEQLKKAKISIDGFNVYAKQVDVNNPYQVHLYVVDKLEKNESYTIVMDNISSAYDIEVASLSKTFKSNDIERNAIEVEVTQLSEQKLLLSFNRDMYAFTDKDPLAIYTISYDNKYEIVDTDNYHVISANEIVLDYDFSDNEVQYLLVQNMYLSGDQFNVGDIKVMIE